MKHSPVTTIDEAQAAARQIRAAWRSNIRKLDHHQVTAAEFHDRQRKLTEQEYILAGDMLQNGLHEHLLNVTILFQARFGDNLALGRKLEEKFPFGKDDSETAQGYFHVPISKVLGVVDWLRSGGRAKNIRVRESSGLVLK